MAAITANKIEGNLDEIRNQVKTKSDAVPFLMVPVRVETRFMKSMRESSSYTAVFSEALYNVVELQELLDVDARKVTERVLTAMEPKLTKGIQAIKANLANLGGITPQERSWLKDEVTELYEKGAQFFKVLLKNRFSTTAGRLASKLSSAFHANVQSLLKSIAVLSVEADTTYVEVAQLIEVMKVLESRARTVLGDTLPHTRPGRKDRLVSFVMSVLYAYAEFYRRDLEYYSTLIAIKDTQLNRIKELHGSLKKSIREFPAKLKKVHTDEAWIKFVDQVNKDHIESLDINFEYFEEQVLEKFEALVELQTVPATKIFYDSLKTYKTIKRFNKTASGAKFNDVKIRNKKVLSRLRHAAIEGQKVIKANKDDALELEGIWNRIDKEIQVYNKQLKSVKVDKPSQQHSVDNTVIKVNTVAGNKLNTFKDISKGAATTVSPKVFANSANMFSTTMARLRGIDKKLTKISTPKAKVSTQEKKQVAKDIKKVTATLKKPGQKIVLTGNRRIILNNKIKETAEKLKETQVIKTPGKTVDTQAAGREIETLIKKVALGTATGAKNLNENFNDDAVFVANMKPVKELWVRIYPDDFAIHTHEEKLTQQEVDTAKEYWKEVWIASGDRDLTIGAWRALCEIHGVQRAAYIAKKLDPKTVSSSNATKFETYPDANLISAIARLDLVIDQIKKVTKKDGGQIILTKLNESQLSSDLTSAINLLNKEDHVHEYLFYKLVDIIRKIQSRFAIIAGQIESGVSHNLIGVYNPIFLKFNTLQQIVAGMEVLPPLEFFQKTTITFTYPVVQMKEEDWTQAPHCRIMPDRFVVLARQGDTFTNIKVGNKLIGDKLQVGLDPTKFDLDDIYQYTENGDLEVDPDIKWLTDYHTAEIKGMGITLTLSPGEFANGFDQIIVLGIKDGSAVTGKKMLEDLLENHHYTPGGMELLKLGDATNNTEDAKSAYSQEVDFEKSYDLEIGEPLYPSTTPSDELDRDGKLLHEALGVSYGMFQHIKGSGKQEMSMSHSFNRAVFPSTMGYYLFEMMNGMFMEDDINQVESFFSDYVSARGKLPTIRVDSQPYGIMPTTSFTRFKHANSGLFYQNLTGILKLLNGQWSEIRQGLVANPYKPGGDPQAHFMEMLGLQPTSVEYYSRYGVNTFMTYSKDEKPQQEIYSPSTLAGLFSSFIKVEDTGLTGVKAKQEENRQRILKLEKSKIFSNTFFADQSLLDGERVQAGELSFKDPLNPMGEFDNYIDWLLNKDLFSILGSNNPSDFPAQRKNMLFLLLRQSLLWSYDRAALEILSREDAISSFDKFNIGGTGFMYAPKGEYDQDSLDLLVTKWSFLFRSLNRLDSGEEKSNGKGLNKGQSKSFYDYLVKGSSKENNEQWTMARYLDPTQPQFFNGFPNHNNHNTALSHVKKVRRAMEEIKDLPSAVLDQLTAEHLDLCSYRLDSWLLGLVNQRLDKQRQSNPSGIYLASWGYLENLRPGGARVEVKANKIPDSLKDEENTPIYTDEDNQGYIHMPSINHAITAAVLRAGYKSNEDVSEDVENQMAVNISSARVRMALQLIEGVKNGQEIAAVLGYQLERGLHERYKDAEMDRFIYPLRKKFPLVPEIQVVENEGNYNPNVVHGTDLLDMIDEHLDAFDFDTNFSLFEALYDNGNFSRCPDVLKNIIYNNSSGTITQKNKLLKILLQEIDRIADAFDALGDLALSESVYQIVQGNHVRAGAVLDALARGRNMPQPQISTTPRTGTVLTQRVVFALETIASTSISPHVGHAASTLNHNLDNAKPAGWSSKMTARALAEPSLNKYLGMLLGSADKIKCHVSFERDETLEEMVIGFDELGLHPIDIVTVLNDGSEGGSEINKRIAYLARAKATPKLPLEIPVKINLRKRDGSWPDDVHTLYEMMPIVKQVQTLLSDVRPAGADDLRLPPEEAMVSETTKFQDVAELDRRATDAAMAYEGLASSIDTFFTTEINSEVLDEETFSPGQINTLRALLFNLSDFGEPNAIPDAVIEDNDEIGRDLARQILVIRAGMTKKITEVTKLREKLAQEKNQDNKCTHLTNILKAIFGRSFTIIPHFSLQNKTDIENISSLPEEDGLLRNNVHAMDSWLQGMGRVREKMYSLEMASMLCETLDLGFPEGTPVQLPYTAASAGVPADYWLGAEYPETYHPEGDKLSIVLYQKDELLKNTDPKAAMILDEWLEIIPNKTETTGLTFNYDQPNATPPQSILLAVTPEETGKWDWDDLVYTIIDTIELAKNRAVEPDHIEKSRFSAILPAISSEIYPPQLTEDVHMMLPNTQVGLDFLGINKE